MLIQWHGSGARNVAGYVWLDGWSVDVADPELIANLLTQPGEMFSVASADPLARIEGVGPVHAALLAVAGVCSVEALAGLDKDGIRRVAAQVHGDASDESIRLVERWAFIAGRALTFVSQEN